MNPSGLDWDVELKIGDAVSGVHITIDGDLLLGRTPSGTAEIPSFDLTPYQAAELGVSRRHGVMSSDGEALYYKDLDTDNGSVLNGHKLNPQQPVRLTSDDVLYLGHMKITVSFKGKPHPTAIAATRPGITIHRNLVNGKGQRILVVEDDAGMSDLYRLRLERSGFNVQVVRDVVSAIRALNRATPNAIILDLMLPGVRGLELSGYVRRDPDCPTIPIIVTSALKTPEMIKEALSSGVDVYVTKPFDWRELIRVVSSVVTGAESEQPGLQTKKLAGTAKLDQITTQNRPDTLVIFVEGYQSPFSVAVHNQATMGRYSGAPKADHVELEPYGAVDHGVSRLHAVIRQTSPGVFEVEDLDSANGTFINGVSLAPHQPRPLKNGSELRLGELRMRVYSLSETHESTLA